MRRLFQYALRVWVVLIFEIIVSSLLYAVLSTGGVTKGVSMSISLVFVVAFIGVMFFFFPRIFSVVPWADARGRSSSRVAYVLASLKSRNGSAVVSFLAAIMVIILSVLLFYHHNDIILGFDIATTHVGITSTSVVLTPTVANVASITATQSATKLAPGDAGEGVLSMDWLQVAANFAQIFSVFWTLVFGSYALHEILSKRPSIWSKLKLPKINISIFFLVTVTILLITVLVRVLTWGAIPYFTSEEYGKGLDLEVYCASLGYETNSGDKSCSRGIDLNAACQWQHQEANLSFKLTNPNDPKTGICYNHQDESVGGISDMSGYCNSRGYKGGTSEAVVVNSSWVCQTNINATIACIWQNGILNMQARNDNNGSLGCYKN